MTGTALAQRLLLSTVLLVALLAAVEVALRLRGVGESPADFRFQRMTPAVAEDRAGRYASDPLRLYTLAPDFRHSPTHLGRDATGDWPFRGRPPEPAPPWLLRVAVVGDSVVYGSSLDAADMPGNRLADALARRGWTPDRVAVLSLGVPGYSTVQLGLLLDEALATLHPDAVVLWPAAWNDQAPALSAPDAELLGALAHPTPLDWLRQHSRLVGALLGPHGIPADRIVDGWRRGAPPCGFRVPAGAVGRNVTGMLQRCALNHVPAVVLASAHPPQTAAEHPRTRQDAAAVLAAARVGSVTVVDAQALLDGSGADPALAFVDYVHPAPETNALVGEALAQALVPLLEVGAARHVPSAGAAGAPTVPLSIVEVAPTRVPVLGDTKLRVTLAGWTAGEALPAVIVGGAPLLDLRAAGEHAIEGTAMANSPGRHALVVQSASGCAWLPEAVEYADPAITIETPPGGPARLVVAARPGDSVRVLVAAGRAAAPHWSPRGAYWLDASARPLPGDRVADAGGLASWTFDQAPPGRFLIQALIAPAGEAPDAGLGARWTAVIELSAPPAAPAPAPQASSPGAR